ncbi:MAG TPA: PRC-barrel domain containing protein [Candidatus Krumholzibacteria bacterium]|nr:PRC-barrel domain containing protein [Candidatus Krumholzibacteria bacterium]
MLRAIGPITGCELLAQDGLIGRCRDFLFDDHDWSIRWMVADTGKWLAGRQVLVAPAALGTPDWRGRKLPLRLTREQVEQSPPLAADAPVSRRWERAWFGHFGFPHYWEGLGAWGIGAQLEPEARHEPGLEPSADEGDPHLRSCQELIGYHVEASDGPIGHVDELIVDDGAWRIALVVLRTRNLLPGPRVLAAVGAIAAIDAAQRLVTTPLGRDDIRDSVAYSPGRPVTTDALEQARGQLGRLSARA